jgi:FKBP-type peptidyl-prolyl cis-trans isomerase SlyD
MVALTTTLPLVLEGWRMTIEHQKVVTVHYHLTSMDGQVIESSRGREPLTYLHGAGTLLPSLERALTGLDVGATPTVVLAPAEAYGEHDATKMETLPRSAFARVPNLAIGMHLEGQDAHGQTCTVRVVEIREDTVVIDVNHPLAGETLTFAMEVLAIREATADELTHGHAHEAGGHAH